MGKKLLADEIFEEFSFVIQHFKISEICGFVFAIGPSQKKFMDLLFVIPVSMI